MLVGFLAQLCFEGLTDLTEAETMAGAPPDLLFRAIFYRRRILSPMLCNVLVDFTITIRDAPKKKNGEMWEF